ncbi:hypothetical protein [Alteribacter populi]|uniref:hypothetical protein n=1 Tax=Alteribacter populi TaxID=2011011 RepID=UPI0012FE7443|nr:hypothetical protein [Alteribacter populi]
MPGILITIAWVIVGIRSTIRFVKLINTGMKDWLEVLFHLSIILIALSFIL